MVESSQPLHGLWAAEGRMKREASLSTSGRFSQRYQAAMCQHRNEAGCFGQPSKVVPQSFYLSLNIQGQIFYYTDSFGGIYERTIDGQ